MPRHLPFSLTKTHRKYSSPVLTSSNSTTIPLPLAPPSYVASSARSIACTTSGRVDPFGASPRSVACGGKTGPGRDEMREERVAVAGSEGEGESQRE